ncbi:response regulator [Pseudomonas sp. ALS1131]|nr:response regulator [Pseudomonas sp. ALS1131]TRO30100.1 response regulator [Pseudomonas sp. ALS1131]
MLKILVVEDNQDKLRNILAGLTSIEGCSLDNIDKARDAQEAKALLRKISYDLMILDIAIPESSDLLPSPNGGITLLNEIIERDIYFSPREVVGLTAYADSKALASVSLGADLWTTLEYNPSSNEWLENLTRKLRHIIQTKFSASTAQEYQTDICIITALRKPELYSVLNLPWGWSEYNIQNDPTTYHRCNVNIDSKDRSIIAASAPRMGMPAAAALSMKMIMQFKPRYIIMPGISAGIRGKVELGDVIVADPSWDYGNGKRSLKDKVPMFSAAPHQISLDPFIRKKFEQLSNDATQIATIKAKWPAKCPPALSIHIAPLASGAAVLEDPSITEHIQDQHRKVLGIEMEAYGVFSSAQESLAPRPTAIVIKSVCDFADEEKNDDYQDYAAFTSAQALRIFIESYLFN